MMRIVFVDSLNSRLFEADFDTIPQIGWDIGFSGNETMKIYTVESVLCDVVQYSNTNSPVPVGMPDRVFIRVKGTE